MSAVLVTGGAGFLGRHLCAAHLAAGDRVVCLDSFVSGRRDAAAALARGAPGRLQVVEHDVTEPLPAMAVDLIYNLACVASPPLYQADPVGTLRACLLGTLHALALARTCGARLLQASTSEVYGDPRVHPQDEGYRGHVSCRGPRACYDEGKRCAETLCYDHARQYGVEVRVARIFNTYGPGMRRDDGRVVSTLVDQALRGTPLTVYGDGSQTRSFCYVDDMIAGLRALMGAPGPDGPVNLGNPQEVSVRQLAERVLAAVHRPGGVIVARPLPVDDPTRRCPDIALAQRLLGWMPRVGLTEGLAATVAACRAELALQ